MPRIALAALLLAACGQPAEESAAEEKKEDGEETPSIPVEVSAPTRGDIYAIYAGTAPIEAFAEADVIAKVGGEVRQLLVEEGDDVVENLALFRGEPKPQTPFGMPVPGGGEESFREYEVNVLVDNTDRSGAPVVTELAGN